jgi:hypothetical protein
MANIDIRASRRGVLASLRQEVCGTPQSQAAVRDGARFLFVYRNTAGNGSSRSRHRMSKLTEPR